MAEEYPLVGYIPIEDNPGDRKMKTEEAL